MKIHTPLLPLLLTNLHFFHPHILEIYHLLSFYPDKAKVVLKTYTEQFLKAGTQYGEHIQLLHFRMELKADMRY